MRQLAILVLATVALGSALASTVSIAADAYKPDIFHHIEDENVYYTADAPSDIQFCRDPEAFRSWGYFATWRSVNCAEFPPPVSPPEVVFFRPQHHTSEEQDEWGDFKRDCRIRGADGRATRTLTAQFLEGGRMVDGLPTRICVRTYEAGSLAGEITYRKTLFVKRPGESQIDGVYYTFSAEGPISRQEDLEKLLRRVLPAFKIEPPPRRPASRKN